MPPIINFEKCNNCGICVEICPLDILKMNEKGVPEVRYPDECWHCNSCKLDCPRGAIYLRFPLPLILLHVEAKETENYEH